ncbi:MAG: GIDE domain-containing protein [Oligoflexales bacterium]
MIPNQIYIILLVSIPVVFVGATLYIISKRLRDIKAIKETPTSKITNANGYVELAGKQYSWNNNSIISPLQKNKCSWFDYEIEVSDTSISGGFRWTTIKKGRSCAPIVLGDGSGYCLIDPEGADVVPTRERMWFGTNVDPKQGKQMNNFLGYLATIAGALIYRFHESVMFSEAHIYAIGQIESTQVDAPKIGAWLSDYPELSYVLKGRTIKILSNKNLPKGRPFIISDKKEQDLLKVKRMNIFVFSLAIFFLIALGLYLTNVFYS